MGVLVDVLKYFVQFVYNLGGVEQVEAGLLVSKSAIHPNLFVY